MTDDLTPAGESAVRLALTTVELRREIDRLTADNDRLRDNADAVEDMCDEAIKRGGLLGPAQVRARLRAETTAADQPEETKP